jgi:hypothetical protein
MKKKIIEFLAWVLCVKVVVVDSRYFRHKTGFGDGTKFVEVKKSGESFLYMKEGGIKEVTELYDMQSCLDRVTEGDWIELFFE